MYFMSVRFFVVQRIRRMLLPGLLLSSVLMSALLTGSATAHEFWIEPVQYQVDKESVLEAYLRNGEEFSGSKIAYVKNNTARFDIATGDRTEAVVVRSGDNPALKMQSLQAGLHVVVHQSSVSVLSYTKWEKFQRFADHKDFPDILARHRERSLSESQFKEAYTRYSKSLIGVESGEGSDIQAGLELELVALQNPYTDDTTGGVKLVAYYQKKLRPDAQIELFEKSPSNEVTVTLHRTDEQGMVVLPVKSSHRYLVDMVVLREPSKQLAKKENVVWETLWASLTFAVP